MNQPWRLLQRLAQRRLSSASTSSSALDHRRLSNQQKLFVFHDASPGSPFFLPHGTRIINALLELMRRQYRRFGYHEIVSPLLYKQALWKQSGHWDNYRDCMFSVQLNGQRCGEQIVDQTYVSCAEAVNEHSSSDEQFCSFEHFGNKLFCDIHSDIDHSGSKQSSNEHSALSDNIEQSRPDSLYALKPMNCPGHCLLFASTRRTYKELPLRWADFSPLHRNEASGALTGLTRVRKFHQDDAHIFCSEEQIASEISSTLKLIECIYSIFRFAKYDLTLSTRPERYVGSIDEWTRAESALRVALDNTGKPWGLNEGDGAFYGPKIDVRVTDSMGKPHQTATIQLDFQLPQRFGLTYTDVLNEPKTPTVIHRAVLGSIERMFAILIEHYQGKWPFWISPRQAMIIPVSIATTSSTSPSSTTTTSEEHIHAKDEASGDILKYASTVNDRLFACGFWTELDASSNTLNSKIRSAQTADWNYILVVGDRERKDGTISIRQRGEHSEKPGKVIGVWTIEQTITYFEQLRENYQ